jgi:hypothetical protein
MPSRTSSHGPILRDDTTTEAPSPAIVSTIERPIPFDEPVTIATFPSSRNISI